MATACTSATSQRAGARIREPFPLTPLAGLFAVILTGVLWGTIGVVTGQLKAAFPNASGSGSALSSLVLVAIRLGITAPAAAIVARLLLGRGAFRLPRRAIGFGLGLGLVQAFFQYAYVEAVTNAGVGIATAIELCLAPVLVAALSIIALRERPDRLIVVAILVAAVGTIILAANGSSPKFAATFSAGIAWSLACMMGYASYIVLARRLAGGIHPLELVALASLGGAAVLAVPAAQIGLPPLVNVDFLAPALQFGYLALIATSLAYALFVSGVRATSATTGSLGALAMPPTATVLAALLLNQIPTIEIVVGQVLLMAAMAVTIMRTAQVAKR
jgi:DME family drug/metabolite transporter